MRMAHFLHQKTKTFMILYNLDPLLDVVQNTELPKLVSGCLHGNVHLLRQCGISSIMF